MLDMSKEEFRLLTQFIKENSGINMREEKKTLLIARLGKILNEKGMDDFKEYYDLLQRDVEGKELSRLVDAVTTNHTFFMREPEHFHYFSQKVLPELTSNVKNHEIRVWCAASSSGEEPYSLAMVMEDYFANAGGFWNRKLLATDLSSTILDEARRGVYEKEKIMKLPKIWILNYFDKIDDEYYVVKPRVKQDVVYRRFNLLEPVFPFKHKFHVIFCRNVMIYFDTKTKDELIEKFYDFLEPGGYLFMGHTESANREKTRFQYICPAVYRKM